MGLGESWNGVQGGGGDVSMVRPDGAKTSDWLKLADWLMGSRCLQPMC